MLEEFKGNLFEYTKLSEQEQKDRCILGRLSGVIADGNNSTRNGRKYTRELWEKVFDNPLMEEKIKNRTCFGELGHPEDRIESDISKVAICLAEKPKFGKDGKLYGVFDILDTPNGRILKTLCDYGFTPGLSSRGEGTLVTDPDTGEEMVDPDSYDCECWDVVLTPAVESARLSYVKEGLEKDGSPSKPNLMTALRESLDTASVDDRRVMESTLKDLGINITSPDKPETITLTESGALKQTHDEPKEAIDDGSDELIRSLQEALKAKTELEAQVQSLQEQLAVSNTKVDSLNEECSKYKATTIRLSSLATSRKELAQKVSTLEEELKVKQQTIDSLTKEKVELVESKKSKALKESIALTEAVKAKDNKISSLNESLVAKENEIKSLTEELSKVKSESSKQLEEATSKLAKQTQIKEEYKKLAINTTDRYIASKATMLGITEDEIKNKLPIKYTLDDIDTICESLQEYALNIQRLPFSVDRKVKATINESKTPSPMKPHADIMDDDAVSDSLLRMSGLK